jgi:hypothetical protein
MAKPGLSTEQFLRELAAAPAQETPKASTRLKSKLYTALLQEAESTAPLRSIAASRQAGYGLCWWEKTMHAIPSEQVGKFNHCRVCHARFVGELVEDAPLPWEHCPYAKFQKG